MQAQGAAPGRVAAGPRAATRSGVPSAAAGFCSRARLAPLRMSSSQAQPRIERRRRRFAAVAAAAEASSARTEVEASGESSGEPEAGLEASPLAKEVAVARVAVRLAAQLCQRVQAGLMRAETTADTKADRSLVTVADYATQALISWCLAQELGEEVRMVAEEDSDALTSGGEGGFDMLRQITEAVNEALAAADGSLPGGHDTPPVLDGEEVLKAIDRGGFAGGKEGRHWVLDPVDGTLGFVRGDQYAIALALVEDGEVVLGALGCPNMPASENVIEYEESYTYGYTPAQVSRMLAGANNYWTKGCLFTAVKGFGCYQEPMDLASTVKGKRVTVTEACGAEARFCEPVMKANSSQGFTASVATKLGITSKPLRVYSQVKYGSVARGDAEVFMKFPKAGYREKSWDHAAGVIIVEEAGGMVSDASGKPLDLSGRYIDGLDRGIVASTTTIADGLLNAVAESWESSQL